MKLGGLELMVLALSLLMWPGAFHRIVEHGEATEHCHRFAGRMLIAAMIPLALGITGDLSITIRKVTESPALALLVALLSIAAVYGMWFGYTIYCRASRKPAGSAKPRQEVVCEAIHHLPVVRKRGEVMSATSETLHGNAPDTSRVALLIIDVINDLEFEGGDELLKNAMPVAEQIAALKRRVKQFQIPVIYVNDNFGRWQSDFKKLLLHCLKDGVCGQPLAELLRPDDDDYFVLKPKHSGFFSTTLHVLLQYLGARTLILTGLTGDICILFTANDAYMRDYRLFIPADCVASQDEKKNRQMLEHMSRVLKADIRLAEELDLKEMKTSE